VVGGLDDFLDELARLQGGLVSTEEVIGTTVAPIPMPMPVRARAAEWRLGTIGPQ
jgi:hypothetical protein